MLSVFVGTVCGGAGKLCISVDLVDSVDLGFLERVGAMLLCFTANVYNTMDFEIRFRV
jgi:hypothetical protein